MSSTTELKAAKAREFQMLITGAIFGALMKAQGAFLNIDVQGSTDPDGNYEPVIDVRGRETETRLRIAIDIAEDGT